MKNLLLNIKSALQDSEILDYIRDEDIFISPHIDFFPNMVKFPCIGIKDGEIERKPGMSDTIQKDYTVYIILFENLQKNTETTIIGDESTERKGLLGMEDDVHSILDDNSFDDRFDSAFCSNSEESRPVIETEASVKQEKVLTYKYEEQCGMR